MAKPVSQQKLLWHLTALDNLESIFKNGLLARDSIKKFVDIADCEIIKKRTSGGLGGFVPFHFFRGNPFDGKVLKTHTDKEFCFITVRRDLAKKNKYKILPKHPLSSEDFNLCDYDEGMKKIDWKTVDKRDYKDQECKVACMAECLAPGRVAPKDFFSIAVKTKEDKSKVKKLVSSLPGNNDIHIDIEPDYF
jgi:hypothetical protein